MNKKTLTMISTLAISGIMAISLCGCANNIVESQSQSLSFSLNNKQVVDLKGALVAVPNGWSVKSESPTAVELENPVKFPFAIVQIELPSHKVQDAASAEKDKVDSFGVNAFRTIREIGGRDYQVATVTTNKREYAYTELDDGRVLSIAMIGCTLKEVPEIIDSLFFS